MNNALADRARHYAEADPPVNDSTANICFSETTLVPDTESLSTGAVPLSLFLLLNQSVCVQ